MNIERITLAGQKQIILKAAKGDDTLFLLRWDDDECYEIVSADTYIHAELRQSSFTEDMAKKVFMMMVNGDALDEY